MIDIIEKIKLIKDEDYEEELLDLEDKAYDETSIMEEYYERKYGK